MHWIHLSPLQFGLQEPQSHLSWHYLYLHKSQPKKQKTQWKYSKVSLILWILNFCLLIKNWERVKYEFIGGGDNGIDHVANAMALKEAVLVGIGLVLEVLHYESLHTLYLLVSRTRHLQQRRRHLLLSRRSICS